MKCINFDRAFERYMAGWMKENSEKYKDDMDVIEDMMPDVYLEFLQKPADFLDGVAPRDSAEKSLLALFARENLPEEAEMTAISLLREMESKAPMQRYIDFIASLEEPSDKGDLCAEALMSMGEGVVAPIFDALSGAGQTGRDIFADILSNYPGDERIYELMTERFATRDERRALFASYLAKLGDERAIPMLKEAAQSPDINYLDYVEVVNAIEALGGERPPEREFSGDPYYESLKQV